MQAQSKTRLRTRVSAVLLFGLVLASASLGSNVQAPDQRAVEYQYDALDRLTQVTYDGELTVTYDYDAAGNLQKVLAIGPLDQGVGSPVAPVAAGVGQGAEFSLPAPTPPSAPRAPGDRDGQGGR